MNVTVKRSGGDAIDSAYVEVVGTVGADLTIDEARTTYFGNTFGACGGARAVRPTGTQLASYFCVGSMCVWQPLTDAALVNTPSRLLVARVLRRHRLLQ